jgi:hypothetical protein
MSKPLLTALALSLGSLMFAPSAAAQELYCSVYQDASNANPQLYTGQTEAQFEATFNGLGSGEQMYDVEAWYDAVGQLRYDCHTGAEVSPQFAGDQKLQLGLTQADLELYHAGVVPQYHLSDLTSYLVADGTRRYTGIWSLGDRGDVLYTGLDPDQYDNKVSNHVADKLAPMVYETWYDADEVRRVDVVFQDAHVNAFTNNQMNLTNFLATHATQQGLDHELLWFESHRQASGTQLYAATWDSEGFNNNPMDIVINEDLTTFLSTYQDRLNLGHRLIDMVHLEEVTPAGRAKYGTGLDGTNGKPSLFLTAKPFLGFNAVLEMGNSAGTTALSGLFLGLAPANLPFKGGELLVLPAVDPLLIPLPAAGLDLPVTLPSDPFLDGVHVYLQSAVQDAGAPKGVALSRGYDLTFGALD